MIAWPGLGRRALGGLDNMLTVSIAFQMAMSDVKVRLRQAQTCNLSTP